MAIDRRNFLIGTAMTLASAHASHAFADVLDADLQFGIASGDLIAACRRPDGTYSVVILSVDGTILRELPLEGRGHDIALYQARGEAVVFARRPGSFALAFDIHGRREPVLFTTPATRHFYGHGTFSRDGRLLYATEHDNSTRAGVIGVYDASGGYRRIGEFPTFGVGPHEAILMADGRTLAVANGGIETHIEPGMTGREKLNVETMQPSLAFIDSSSGRLISQHMQSSGLHKLSIRHLAQDASGAIWFGCQWEGAEGDTPELIGCAGIDTPLRIIEPADPIGAKLAGYIGSVAISGDGRLVAASAPRAGRIVYVDTERRVIVGETLLMDSCAIIAASEKSFAMTSGMGIVQVDAPDHTHLATMTFPGRSFDNHVRMIS
ncbi:DUF1513 domain-containing protein [Hyphomicrobium sp. 1Nfss2.1]